MNKQPKLVLRESCVNDVSRSWPPGEFLEVGAGTGHMASLFVERGFRGVCHDLGASNRALIRKRPAVSSGALQVVDDLGQLDHGRFDYILAFEVLEHIDEDLDVLREWLSYLRPGGRFLASVPAHARKFGASDHMAGHVRRYEKSEFRSLLEGAGLSEISIVNYGFPITELTRPLSNYLVRNDRSVDGLSAEEKSIRSAQKKSPVIDRVLSRMNDGVVQPFCLLQRIFYPFDLGDGYVASAVKKP